MNRWPALVLYAAVLAACSSNAGAAHHVYSPCTVNADCPSDYQCVEGVDGGRFCSVECDGTDDCSLLTTSGAYCMVRTGLTLGVCAARCPSSSSSGEHGCLAEYGTASHEYSAGSIPACVCTE